MTRQTLSLLLTCVVMGFKRSMASKSFILGSFITYTVLMIVYVSIIKMIPLERIEAFGLTHLKMIWYLATAEMIVFSGSGWAFKELQNDFANENIHTSLIRPSSFMLVRVGIWFGESVTRITCLFPFYLLLMTAMSGAFIMRALDVALLFAALPFSMLMVNCAAYLIGASCLWLLQSEPVYWLWEKCVFLLGCMLWPMAVYPAWLKAVCWMTPFPGILSVGAQSALGDTGVLRIVAFGHQLLWGVAFIFLMRWFDRKILRRIQTGGV